MLFPVTLISILSSDVILGIKEDALGLFHDMIEHFLPFHGMWNELNAVLVDESLITFLTFPKRALFVLAEEVSHKTKCTISPPETRTGRRLRLPDAAQAQAESPISAPGQIPDKPLKGLGSLLSARDISLEIAGRRV